MKLLRVGIRLDRHRVAHMHGAHVALVDIDENPHAPHVGNRKDLRGACLDHLPGRSQPFHGLAGDGRKHRNFRHRGVLRQAIGMLDSHDLQGLFRGLQVSLRLVLG